MSSLALSFHDVNFNPIPQQDNQIWLTGSELATALGYARVDSLNKVYERNADEFTDSMTHNVILTLSNKNNELQEVKTRIFSLRGCHLIAMLARTAVAKQFRKWVLDILDKEVTHQAINPRQTITPEQQAILHSIVDRRVNGFDSLRGGLWKRHNRHFGIAKYNQLLASRFDDAVAYLETAELTYPKPKEKINDGCYFLMAKDGVVIYQLPISQQAINSELANNKPLLLEHIKQVVGEFVGKEALPAPKQQDKFEALKKDLAQFCAPEDPHLQITYPTAQRTLSLLSALIVNLENHGFNMALMYQKTQYVQNFLTNYYSRLEAIHYQMNSISKHMSLDAINYAADICKHPTVVSCYGAKIA